MAQRKKTPKHLVVLINNFQDYLEHMEKCMLTKTMVPVENQADHIRNVSDDRMIGQVIGASVMLENALMAYGCYNGFVYVSPLLRKHDGTTYREMVGPSSQDFAEWRRSYSVRL